MTSHKPELASPLSFFRAQVDQEGLSLVKSLALWRWRLAQEQPSFGLPCATKRGTAVCASAKKQTHGDSMRHPCISFRPKASNMDHLGSRSSRGLETVRLFGAREQEPPPYNMVCFVHAAADLGPHSTVPEDNKQCLFNGLRGRMPWHSA